MDESEPVPSSMGPATADEPRVDLQISLTRGRARRPAGHYARSSARRLRMHCLLLLGLFAVFTDLMGRAFGLHHLVFEGSEVLLLCGCFAVSHWALPLVHRREQGADGEERVGAILEDLVPHGWHVIHDAHLERGNVDHVLVGPPGLFTVETKSHAGPVQVRNLHGGLIRQVHAQRQRIEELAGIRAEPLLVYSTAWVDNPGGRRKGVRVVPARMLTRHLQRRPARLSAQEVDDLHRRLVASLGS